MEKVVQCHINLVKTKLLIHNNRQTVEIWLKKKHPLVNVAIEGKG